MPSEFDQPAHNAYWLVEFTWGASNVLRVTDWEDDVVEPNLGTFEALPTLEVRLPTKTGALDEQPLELVVLRSTKTLFEDLTKGEPFATVTVKVYESAFTPGGTTPATVVYHYEGRISQVVRNFQNRAEQVKIEALSVKSELDVPLGLPATPQCPWTLGDGVNCLAALPNTNGTVNQAYTQKIIEITGLSPPGGDVRYYERGYLELDGLRIGIRRWVSTDPTTFHLRQKLPAAWIGLSVRVVPGCDKTIETCRARWGQEERFAGFGYSIPDYQPNYETPF